jgi:hypothetical protein
MHEEVNNTYINDQIDILQVHVFQQTSVTTFAVEVLWKLREQGGEGESGSLFDNSFSIVLAWDGQSIWCMSAKYGRFSTRKKPIALNFRRNS